MKSYSRTLFEAAQRGLVGAIALTMATSATHAGGSKRFSELVSLGDSLSDTGRFYVATGGTLPPAPYFEGRFCNGPVWNEHLGSLLDLDLEPEGQLAFGGAFTGSGNYQSVPPSFVLPGFEQQVDSVLARKGNGRVDSRALYTVWIGANDFFAWLESGAADPTPMMVTGVGNTVQGIAEIAAAGGRNFVVVNLPDLGRTPTALGLPPGVAGILSYLSAGYNALLAQQLDALEEEYQVRIVRVDAYALINDMVARPEDYGFTNVTDAALFHLPGANPDEYLFWDGVHPTTVAQEFVAAATYESLNEEFPISPPGWVGRESLGQRSEQAAGWLDLAVSARPRK